MLTGNKVSNERCIDNDVIDWAWTYILNINKAI